MVGKLLVFICCFLFVCSMHAQEKEKVTTEKSGSSVTMWKNVKPERLEASELMILPSNKFLRLNLKEDLGFTKVVIQDLNGITLIENKFDPNRDIDISILKPGNYLIKVISANRVLQGKFGKRRL